MELEKLLLVKVVVTSFAISTSTFVGIVPCICLISSLFSVDIRLSLGGNRGSVDMPLEAYGVRTLWTSALVCIGVACKGFRLDIC